MLPVIIAVATIATLATIAGIALAVAARRLPARENDLVEQVNLQLPQTQCAQCGYPGCRPYARAIVEDGEAINLCPPGGDATVAALAELLNRETLPLAAEAPAARSVAIIDESRCIGCTHCRAACPVDAIFGAQQTMHTVIESECTGCELCLAPCPVDCISLRPLG
jgi:electron transport complex protein RnfB